MITLYEYRKFCETTYCAPVCVNRFEYLSALLIEEAGEVASLFAKAMRDETVVDLGALQKELGDVLWAVTMLSPVGPETEWPDVVLKTPFPLRALALLAGAHPHDMLPILGGVYLGLGFSFEGLAAANMEKLRDRKARGVLKGSGDDR